MHRVGLTDPLLVPLAKQDDSIFLARLAVD